MYSLLTLVCAFTTNFQSSFARIVILTFVSACNHFEIATFHVTNDSFLKLIIDVGKCWNCFLTTTGRKAMKQVLIIPAYWMSADDFCVQNEISVKCNRSYQPFLACVRYLDLSLLFCCNWHSLKGRYTLGNYSNINLKTHLVMSIGELLIV